MTPLFSRMILGLGIVWLACGELTAQQPPERIPEPASRRPVDRLPEAAADAGVVTAEVSRPEAGRVILATATAPSSRVLQDILLRAKGELDATRFPQPEAAKSELQAALAELDNFVAIDSSNGQAWSRFLRLDELRSELAAESPQINNLTDLEMNMRQNYIGLEYPQFLRVRQSLNQYIRALKYGSNPENSIRLLGQKMDELVEELNKPMEGSDLSRSSQVGVVTNYLFESEQVPWAVTAMREQFAYPNVQVYASENLLNRLLGRGVAEPSPVNECILGTRVIGRACLSGGVYADVVPMSNGVSVLLNMSAMMTSQNKGYNRGVVLNTSGSSPVFASKQIFITPESMYSAPASVSTQLSTRIHSIEHRLKIIRKIASKKAAEQKPQADAIAQSRLQNRIRSQYDDKVDEQLAESRSKMSEMNIGQRPELKRLGLQKPEYAIYSTSHSVHGNLVQAASYQLAAESDCQIEQPATADVVLEAHQSAAINALDVLLGGRTVRSEMLDDYAQQLLGEVPEEIRKEANGELWSISMAPFHPVELDFDDGLVKIILRISKMTRGEQTLADPAIISAAYAPSFSDGVLTLTRQGPVDITFARESRGIRVVSLRSFLKGKFESTFKEQIVTKRIDLRERFPRAPELTFSSIHVDDGWLQVGAE